MIDHRKGRGISPGLFLSPGRHHLKVVARLYRRLVARLVVAVNQVLPVARQGLLADLVERVEGFLEGAKVASCMNST